MDLQQRLLKLSDASTDFLLYAIVMGDELQPDVIQQIMPNTSVDDCITECVDASILEPKGDRYYFIEYNACLELIASEMTATQFKAAHHAVADALEHVYGDGSNTPVAKALAYHWKQAGVNKKEERYVTFAGEQALANCDYDDALSDFTRAIRLVDTLDIADTKKKRKYIHLYQRSGEAYLGLNDYDKARDVFQLSLDLCESLNHDISIAVALGHLGSAELADGNLLEAKQIHKRALNIYRARGNDAGIKRTLNQLSKIDDDEK